MFPVEGSTRRSPAVIDSSQSSVGIPDKAHIMNQNDIIRFWTIDYFGESLIFVFILEQNISYPNLKTERIHFIWTYSLQQIY